MINPSPEGPDLPQNPTPPSEDGTHKQADGTSTTPEATPVPVASDLILAPRVSLEEIANLLPSLKARHDQIRTILNTFLAIQQEAGWPNKREAYNTVILLGDAAKEFSSELLRLTLRLSQLNDQK